MDETQYRRLRKADRSHAAIDNMLKVGEAKQEKPKYGEAGSYRYSEVLKNVHHRENSSVLNFIKNVKSKDTYEHILFKKKKK